MITITLIQGDAKEVLKQLPDNSIHVCVTSPPYWGLRDYGEAGQLGLEDTPYQYIEKLVDIANEIKRVLRPDGTFWLNIGDTYNSGAGNKAAIPADKDFSISEGIPSGRRALFEGLKPKDLCLVPFRTAIALQEAGWWVRSDIIWAKGVSFCDTYSGSVMPEAVNDRPTRGHEYIFLLTKSERYFYDLEAVREPLADSTIIRDQFTREVSEGKKSRVSDIYAVDHTKDSKSNPWGRNIRTVWAVGIAAYAEAHFATFPLKLIEPIIKVGTSEKGCCPKCGSPQKRIIDAKPNPSKAFADPDTRDWANINQKTSNPQSSKSLHRGIGMYRFAVTIGWEPACKCGLKETVPCTVLDPFNGSGTSGAVAMMNRQSYIGIDINKKYLDMTEKRLVDTYNSLGKDAPETRLIRIVNGDIVKDIILGKKGLMDTLHAFDAGTLWTK